MEEIVDCVASTKYSEYKPSGVVWLGDIPSHWKFERLKYLFKIQKRIADKLGYDVLSITQNGIKIKDVKSGEGQLSMDYSKYQLVFKGEFAMNHMDLLTGYVDISKFNGVISPDYRVFTLQRTDCSRSYLLRIFQLAYLNRIFYGLGQGVSQLGRWRFPAENFNNFILPIPPIEEQTLIARFLDSKTTQIDNAIAQKEKLIELLKERRQILIHNAVTKGLDPNVKMKDSGVEWIGEIPEHWRVRRLKFLCHITTGSKNTEDKVDGGLYPFFVRSQTPERINSYSFDGEAILTAGDGAGVGKVYHYINGKFDFHQRVYKFSKFNGINGLFLYHYISSNFFNVAILGTAKSTVDSLRLPLIQDFLVSYPASNEEQKQITEFIQVVSLKIGRAIIAKEDEIERLKEYKATLINSAVTGKIKVPDIETMD